MAYDTTERAPDGGRTQVPAAWTAALARLVDVAGDVAGELAAADETVAALVAENEQLRAAALMGVA